MIIREESINDKRTSICIISFPPDSDQCPVIEQGDEHEHQDRHMKKRRPIVSIESRGVGSRLIVCRLQVEDNAFIQQE